MPNNRTPKTEEKINMVEPPMAQPDIHSPARKNSALQAYLYVRGGGFMGVPGPGDGCGRLHVENNLTLGHRQTWSKCFSQTPPRLF